MNQKERYAREIGMMSKFDLSEEYELQIKEQKPGYNIRIFMIEDAMMKFGGLKSSGDKIHTQYNR